MRVEKKRDHSRQNSDLNKADKRCEGELKMEDEDG
jgi:hypothetical protein